MCQFISALSLAHQKMSKLVQVTWNSGLYSDSVHISDIETEQWFSDKEFIFLKEQEDWREQLNREAIP